MKSICIKSIGVDKINFIIDELEKYQVDCYLSYYRFKTYDNLIIHFNDEIENEFYEVLVYIIKHYIEKNMEDSLIRKNVEKNYFYLSMLERKYIYEISKKVLELPDEKIGNKSKLLKDLIRDYIRENKKIYLDGFLNFRIRDYKILLEKIVEVSVFSYLDLITF